MLATQVTIRKAIHALHSVVFFGITDFWNTSVCLFHKALNGPGPRPSEFLNTRPAPYKPRLSNDTMATLRAGGDGRGDFAL